MYTVGLSNLKFSNKVENIAICKGLEKNSSP